MRKMGREQGANQRGAGSLNADEVSAYLRDHPDFLIHNAELVQHLTPPMTRRGGSNIADLQYYMIERLQAEMARLRSEQQDLLMAARANLTNQNRIHAAALFLLDAQSFEQLIQTITTDLAVLLDLDVACLIVESGARDLPRNETAGVRVVKAGSIDGWLGRRELVLCGNLYGDPTIFGGAASLVRSEALIRLHISTETPPGMLAFGSRDPEMFHQGQGTEMLGFLARVVERCLRSWLDLPA
ncbi:MAG: DUF484 family protein [Rhodospirillaceae bacterium]